MTSGSKHPSDEIDVQPVDLEPTRRGYQVTYNYAVHFWLPILGPGCFCIWQALISFCFGESDTCWPSISLLADMASRSNRATWSRVDDAVRGTAADARSGRLRG